MLPAAVATPRAGQRACATLVLVLGLTAAATPLAAQRYLLQLKPRVGDTLRMEVDERREHTGTTKVGAADSTRSMTTHLRMFSRAIVLGKLRGAVTVLAVIDSVSLVSTDQHARAAKPGQHMTFRLGEDGTMRVADDQTAANRRASELVALMPAALPAHPVSIGDRWEKAIPIGVGRTADDGAVHAVFQLDSVSRDAAVAFISMRGDMKRDSVPAGPPRGSRLSVTGSVSGVLQLDRQRGWITESSFSVVLRTTMFPPPTAAGHPVRFLTRITQRMRALDRK